MKALVELPESSAVTVWALEHPALDGLVWIGTQRPVAGQQLAAEIGDEVIGLRWDESMLVRAELSMTAWRHMTAPQVIRCPSCSLPRDAHSPDCPRLAEAQSG